MTHVSDVSDVGESATSDGAPSVVRTKRVPKEEAVRSSSGHSTCSRQSKGL